MSDPKITIRVEGSGLPAGGTDGQVLSKQDGKPVWVDPPKSEDALPITGGTLKGDLNIGSTSETAGAQLRIAKQGADGKGYQMGSYISGGNMARTDYIADGSIANFMQLGPTETGFGKPVRVSSGGTGVTSLEELKKKLDVIPAPSSAQVGQTIVIKAVDENGKPTEWEAADMAEEQTAVIKAELYEGDGFALSPKIEVLMEAAKNHIPILLYYSADDYEDGSYDLLHLVGYDGTDGSLVFSRHYIYDGSTGMKLQLFNIKLIIDYSLSGNVEMKRTLKTIDIS